MIKIVDLDNCIADDGWRIPHIRMELEDWEERYRAYQLLSAHDELKNESVISGDCTLIISTSRPETYRLITHEWLTRHRVPYNFLLMRFEGDRRPSVEVKMEHWKEIADAYCAVDRDEFIVYDDRVDVLGAYKREGIKTAHTKIHNVPYPKGVF